MELAEAQVEWLRSNGGFYSPKVSISPLFQPEDPNAFVPLGLFATEPFAKGETIMIIPRPCLLTAGPDSEDMCVTATNLVEERRLGSTSQFAPYVSYLFSKDRVPLPSTWSDLAQNLVRQIRGRNLPPEDLTDVSFEGHCDHVAIDDGDEEDLNFAYLTVVSRAWSDKLVPVFDMMNHHSGPYWNVDSSSVHGTKDLTVHATRDIPAGEQLFLSYMDCIDEKGFENEYVLPQMLRDFGFVDLYPQRWTFPALGNDIVFDIDSNGELHWRTDEPDPQQILVLKKELHRVSNLKAYVNVMAPQIESEYERSTTLDYYDSLTFALKHATGTADDKAAEAPLVCSSETTDGINGSDTCKETKVASTDGSSTGTTASRTSSSASSSNPEDWMACRDFLRIQEEYALAKKFRTPNQKVEILLSEEEDDACLYLDGYLHTCASSRPHYHEVFVHYPARFLSQVKRVIFIGGGDSMVLHEVMKYNATLELVVGLELDHSVVRSTFRHFGTQPHWDNDSVHWYFGDAAQR